MGVATEKLRGSGVTLSRNVREKEEVAALYKTAVAEAGKIFAFHGSLPRLEPGKYSSMSIQ